MPAPTPLRPVKSGIPAHLGKAESDLYAQVVRAYDLRDEISLKILEEGLASLQRARLARETLGKEGMTFKDGKGRPKIHPLCTVERDARAAALAAFRQLNLEVPRVLA